MTPPPSGGGGRPGAPPAMTPDPAVGASPAPEVLEADILKLPGLVHGFTTRRGGYSRGPFASLSFSPKWPEDRAAVERNLELLARHAGYDPARLFRAFQVHGSGGVVVAAQQPGDVRRIEADFLATGRPGVTVAVITADCVPALIADPDVPAVAAVHAGWRGLVAGVLDRAVAALADRFGSAPGRLRAALGPSIGPCCFEVGPEVVSAFQNALPGLDGLLGEPSPRGRPRLNLWLAARAALERAGLEPHLIADPVGCTACDPELYHSYRRDGPRVGQHLGFIGALQGSHPER